MQGANCSCVKCEQDTHRLRSTAITICPVCTAGCAGPDRASSIRRLFPFFECAYMCVELHMCGGYMWTCVLVLAEAGGHSSCTVYFLDGFFHWPVTPQVARLADKLCQESSCLSVHRAEITRACHQAWLSNIGSRDETQVLSLQSKLLNQLHHAPGFLDSFLSISHIHTQAHVHMCVLQM